MKTKLFTLTDLLAILISGVPFIYLANRYAYLPATVATHFGFDGKADGFSHKSSLWLLLGFTAGAGLLVYLIIRLLGVLDPKKGARYSGAAFKKIAILLMLFVSAIGCLLVYAAEKSNFKMGSIFPVLMGLFFAAMGNFMQNIKPNYFVGIRTPWTLESEPTWRCTHQFGGKLWFAGGILIVLGGLVLPETVAAYFLFSCIFIMALLPIGYSFYYFKSLQKGTNH
jgi:hypothetical protein